MEKPTLSRRSFLASSIKTGIVMGLPSITVIGWKVLN